MNSRVKLSEKAHAYLQEKRFAVLATLNEDGTPQLTTMWYLLEDDGTILMNTKVGRAKERNMRRDPRISVCVEDGYIAVTLLSLRSGFSPNCSCRQSCGICWPGSQRKVLGTRVSMHRR